MRAKTIIRQFITYSNPYNELLNQKTAFMLKTRRVQYVFEKFRNQFEDAKTLTDFAESQLVNEVRFWATKYVTLSWVLGANLAFIGYQLAFKHLKKYVGIPLTFVSFFVSRNLIMKSCMDKIYYPLLPIYERIRAEDKKREKMVKDQLKTKLEAPLSSPDDLEK